MRVHQFWLNLIILQNTQCNTFILVNAHIALTNSRFYRCLQLCHKLRQSGYTKISYFHGIESWAYWYSIAHFFCFLMLFWQTREVPVSNQSKNLLRWKYWSRCESTGPGCENKNFVWCGGRARHWLEFQPMRSEYVMANVKTIYLCLLIGRKWKCRHCAWMNKGLIYIVDTYLYSVANYHQCIEQG
jgi:hypothetical protein